MIDRTYIKRPATMTEWPDWETAPPRALCAPLSAQLESPRGTPGAGNGYIMSPKALAGKVARARVRAEHRRRASGGRSKWA